MLRIGVLGAKNGGRRPPLPPPPGEGRGPSMWRDPRSIRAGPPLVLMSTSIMLAAHAREELLRLGQLPLLDRVPAFRITDLRAASPMIGKKGIEQDQHPAQPEQRIIG